MSVLQYGLIGGFIILYTYYALREATFSFINEVEFLQSDENFVLNYFDTFEFFNLHPNVAKIDFVGENANDGSKEYILHEEVDVLGVYTLKIATPGNFIKITESESENGKFTYSFNVPIKILGIFNVSANLKFEIIKSGEKFSIVETGEVKGPYLLAGVVYYKANEANKVLIERVGEYLEKGKEI
jgi:hypothetical protein